MNGYDTFAPTLDGLVSIYVDNITTENITTGSLNGISDTVIGYLSNARSSLQTQIDGIEFTVTTGVDFTVPPLSYIVTLTGDVQTQLTALSTNVAGVQSIITAPPFSYLSTLRSDVQIQIDSIKSITATGVDLTAEPFVYIVGLTSDAQAQIDALTVITGALSTATYPVDIVCNTVTAAGFVNCNSGIVTATWSANKLRVDDDVYYPDGTFGASPKLQDIVDAKIATSTSLASAALAGVSAYLQSQIVVIDATLTGLVASDLATSIRVQSLEFGTRYISTDYTELPGGIALTGGNTYCSSNFRIGSEGDAPISLYPSGQISATKFAGDECNVDTVYTDVINSKSANGNMHIGSPSLTTQYVQRTITIGDNYPLADCTVKATHDLTIGRRCRAFGFNSVSGSFWIGDDGTDAQAFPRTITMGDSFGYCTISILYDLIVGRNFTGSSGTFSGSVTVGAGISFSALTGAITATGLVAAALTLTTTLNGMPIGYFTGTTSNIQAQMNLKAPLHMPTFTGIPNAPTAGRYDDSTQIATTAYVKSQLYALREDETFIGIPRAPTAPPANNTTQLATTAFVQNQANSSISNVTLTGLPMLTIDSSPVLTDNSYRIASTAFVKGQAYAPLEAPAFTGAVTFSGTLNTITPAVFAFLSGTTSNIQAQLNAVGAGILGATNSWTGATNTFSGLVRITNTTATTSGVTGALVVSGGVGIGKDLYVAGDTNIQGEVFTYDVLTHTGTSFTHNNTVTGVFTQTASTTNISSTTNTNITSTLTTTLTATTIDAVGYMKVTAPAGTASTSTITGGLVVTGGCGISGNIHTSGRTTIAGVTTITNATVSTSAATGALTVGGGVGIGQKLYVAGATSIGGVTTISNPTASTTYTNGALIVVGGVGISGVLNTNNTINTNGIVTISNTTVSSATTNGALVVSGGAGIAKNLIVGGNIRIAGTYNAGNTLSQVVDGSDYCYLEYLRLNTTYDPSVLRINVGNDYYGIHSDCINLNPTGGVGIKTDTPTAELDVVGAGKFSTTLNVTGAITGAGGITTTGGTVSLTSTGAMNLKTSGTGILTIETIKGDVNIKAYEPDNTVTANVNITAGDAIQMTGATIKCNTQMIRSFYTIVTSSYTFTSLDAVPSVVFVSVSGADIYIPGTVNSYYNGLVVTFRGVNSVSSYNIRISGGYSRITPHNSSVNGAEILLLITSAQNFTANLMYIDGYWFNSV